MTPVIATLLNAKAIRRNGQPSLNLNPCITMSEACIQDSQELESVKGRTVQFTAKFLEFLKECFYYDAENGRLMWKVRPDHHFQRPSYANRWNGRYADTAAGNPNIKNGDVDGWGVMLRFDGKRIRRSVHRIIYEMMVGPIPEGLEVDHKDRNPENNRLDNLRLATRSQNQHNIVSRRKKGNATGWPKGVRKAGKRFAAAIMVNFKLTLIGPFDTLGEAADAYKAESLRQMKDFSVFS